MSELVKRYDCTGGGKQFCQGCYTMTECAHGDYVAWEDYERLEQECERLRLAAQVSAADANDAEAKLDAALKQVEGLRAHTNRALIACETPSRPRQHIGEILAAALT